MCECKAYTVMYLILRTLPCIIYVAASLIIHLGGQYTVQYSTVLVSPGRAVLRVEADGPWLGLVHGEGLGQGQADQQRGQG